jgi:hypothetical protein
MRLCLHTSWLVSLLLLDLFPPCGIPHLSLWPWLPEHSHRLALAPTQPYEADGISSNLSLTKERTRMPPPYLGLDPRKHGHRSSSRQAVQMLSSSRRRTLRCSPLLLSQCWSKSMRSLICSCSSLGPPQPNLSSLWAALAALLHTLVNAEGSPSAGTCARAFSLALMSAWLATLTTSLVSKGLGGSPSHLPAPSRIGCRQC